MAEDKTEQTEQKQTETETAQEQDWKAEAEKLKAEAEKLKAESRKWEARSKENFEKLETLKEKADKWDELQDEGKTELERMTERATQAEAELAEMKQAEQVRTWAHEVAAETHVPVSVLRGSSKEELQAHAKAILDSGLNSRSVPDGGEQPASTITREAIEKIPDQMERIMARAKHPELFK